MDKNQCINIFNSMITNRAVDFQRDLLPMLSDYLSETNVKNADKMIQLVVQNPMLMQQTIPTLEKYYCRKYEINKVGYNNQILLYYANTKDV